LSAIASHSSCGIAQAKSGSPLAHEFLVFDFAQPFAGAGNSGSS
jgi:hypothetical protein